MKSDAINNDKGVSQNHPGGQVESHCELCLHSTTYITTLDEQIYELENKLNRQRINVVKRYGCQ